MQLYVVRHGIAIDREDPKCPSDPERYLTEEVFKKPVIVTDYPASIKAFYMRLNEDGKTVRAMQNDAPRTGYGRALLVF